MSVQLVAAFVVALGLGAPVASQESQAPQPIPGGFGRGAYALGPGVEPPELIRQGTVQYTADAPQPGAEGRIEVEAVVLPNGTVRDVRVLRNSGVNVRLQEAALSAARQHLFRPGRVGGSAVPVVVTIEFTFRLPNPVESRLIVRTPEEAFRNLPTPGDGTVSFPEPTRAVDPEYTDQARRRRIQGEVHLEAVVLPDGSVGATRVLRSLDTEHGLDRQAVAAARQWQFKPATANGQPVPVRVVMILTFRLPPS